ncbi:MAG TPA: lytic transglycosylase domain-containing protein [Syntrophales bacterium]|nr:lytic transglycosylase domain-containing protein [Syntrophales bacterium]HOX93593.1 lytic transglycosylase domain-containing protein [Syntrophales bacterium]HPI56888.1 lytic transglycosylase domain-containing protein [Syntrophales bacterium]HPN23474.1 lytic transglycosylase domain-containing protein [Syntrophales bacterium]HQM28001.1 lytic transglycosylase domain-containing protein [Syntrophales bacterium]
MKQTMSPVASLARRSESKWMETTGKGSAGQFDMTVSQALREINGRVPGTDPSKETNLERLNRVIRYLELQMRFNEGLLQIIREMDGREDTVGRSGGSTGSAALSSLAGALTDTRVKTGEGILERYGRVYSSTARETSMESRLASLERRIEEHGRQVSTGDPSTRTADGISVPRDPVAAKSPSMRRETGTGRKVNAGTMSQKTGQGASPYENIIDDASKAYGVDPDLIKAVIRAESSFNPESRSTKGAMGLMQLMPGTAKDLGVNDPYDPVENIMGGTRYLRDLLDRFGNDRNLALAAYNWGMGNVERKPERMPLETRTYVARVNHYYRDQKV